MRNNAVIVISFNSKALTNKLCKQIIDNTHCDYDLIVVEGGTKLSELSDYATIWTRDNIRMTRSFNLGVAWALRREAWTPEKFAFNFWYVVNDSIFPDGQDTLSVLTDFAAHHADCGQIQPFCSNSPSKYQRAMGDGEAHVVSYIETICPMITRMGIEIPKLYDERFYYGWGNDYDSAYNIHCAGYRNYIHNRVSVHHDAGTTVKIGGSEDFTTVLQQFSKSRENMYQGLIEKHGANWQRNILDAIPPDVDPMAYIDWICNIGQDIKYEELIKCKV